MVKLLHFDSNCFTYLPIDRDPPLKTHLHSPNIISKKKWKTKLIDKTQSGRNFHEFPIYNWDLPRRIVTTRMTWNIFRLTNPNLSLHLPLPSWGRNFQDHCIGLCGVLFLLGTSLRHETKTQAFLMRFCLVIQRRNFLNGCSDTNGIPPRRTWQVSKIEAILGKKTTPLTPDRRRWFSLEDFFVDNPTTPWVLTNKNPSL